MDPMQLTLAKSTDESLRALAQIKEPDCALLYACIYAAGGNLALQSAARQLEWTEDRLRRALQMLTVFDLVRDGVKPPIRGKELADPAELLLQRRGDAAFSGVCDYFEQCKGRQMTQREMSILLEVYQNLNLPANVLGLLMGWCQESGHFSIQNVEREAYRWHNQGVLTFPQASEHLESLRRRRTYEASVLRLLGQSGHPATETQKKCIEQWNAWGINRELLELAYDRTVMNCGQLNWKYLHKILESWHAQGFKTRQAVEKGDQRVVAGPQRAGTPAQAQPESAERRILRMLEQKRLQRERDLQSRLETLRGISPEFRETESALRLCASRMARSSGEEREKQEQQRALLLQRQQGILTRLGHPADWLSDKPDCPHCGDRGYIGAKKCVCLERMLADTPERTEV